MTNRLVTIFSFIPLLIFLLVRLLSPSKMIHFLNGTFYIGLLFLVVGSALTLIQGGFFNAFARNSKRFFSTLSKKEQVIREVHQQKAQANGYERSFPVTKYILLLGCIYCLIGVAGSIAFSYFGR
ncbi:DUF3899 domain-containing protein [Filibacter tadaridae]|uniref:DUF3899 domain-containing protein n=1 Tax=Filibacter tadaridae TaxID=2483811 RepID=A0A3P5X8N5_9BACL|nr:DUF3899 domain-containing protein [Filibacter tadaridae]VDC24799.1 hypothetical protein FILTAD_01096 [Filibacter tadaridae]